MQTFRKGGVSFSFFYKEAGNLKKISILKPKLGSVN